MWCGRMCFAANRIVSILSLLCCHFFSWLLCCRGVLSIMEMFSGGSTQQSPIHIPDSYTPWQTPNVRVSCKSHKQNTTEKLLRLKNKQRNKTQSDTPDSYLQLGCVSCKKTPVRAELPSRGRERSNWAGGSASEPFLTTPLGRSLFRPKKGCWPSTLASCLKICSSIGGMDGWLLAGC